MDQPSQEISLGDTVWFASIAYIVVLLPWTVFFAHDFISDRWNTIRSTRRAGMWHLLVFFLAPLLVAYISLQPRSREPDFKEMFTAITALLFGFYHFLRSLEGVIQLNWFKEWATTVAMLMDRGGYWRELQPFNEGKECIHGEQQRKQKELSNRKKRDSNPHHRKSEASGDILRRLDKMRVNNSIVDNELAGSQSPNVSYALHLKTVHSYIVWGFNGLVQVFIGEQRNSDQGKLTTFVRWAVAYLAQFGDNWLRDVAGTALVQSELRRTNKRREFAVKVLAAATLRMGRKELPLRPYPRERKGSLKEPNESDLELTLLCQNSYLPLGAWHRVTKRDEDIVFSREEFASASLRTSFHMPGNNPVLTEDDSNGEVRRKGYSLHCRPFFDPLIAEARSSLHPTLREHLQKHGMFSSQQLEWFAAFLCTQCVLDDTQKKNDKFSSRKHAMQDSNGKMKGSLHQRHSRENENDTSIRFLRRQLGLEDSVATRTFFYPFLKGAYERKFWNNRAILEVSARIDNWTAISSGRQLSFLCERREFWLTQKLPKTHGYFAHYNDSSEAGAGALESNCHGSDKLHTDDRGKKIFNYHKELECESLKYQLTDKQTAHWHMEHGLSFSGCIVESIRSALAEQTFRSESPLEGWCPKLAYEKVQFFPSFELWKCIQQTKNFDTSIQERLLWECQQGVYSSLCKKIEKMESRIGGFDIHKEVEMMLLFVMGFPSIKIRRDSRDVCVFTIRPMLAPQPLQVRVFIHAGKYNPLGRIKPTAVLSIEAWSQEGLKWVAPADAFCWRDWRDSFEGRLEGRFQWQQSHFLPAARIMKGRDRREKMGKSAKEIEAHAKGENPPLVWEGWKPFRAGMAIFELKHILSSQKGYPDKRTIERHESATDIYDRTTPALLSAAMLRLDVLLGHGEGLEELQNDLKERELYTGRKTFSKRRNIFDFFTWNGEAKSVRDEDKQREEALEAIDQLLNDAKEFEARAMYDLACNLDGSEFAKPELVFNLMQGALHIDRADDMANSFVEKLLKGSSNLSSQKRQEAIEKARYAVDLLWLDVEAKHKKEWKYHARQMNRDQLKEWREKINGEKKRLNRIINLHKQVLKEQTTGTMMNELAERITKYGATKNDENTAIELYESSVIANADPLPILKLATIHASRTFGKDDRRYAHDLLRKALYVARTGPHNDILDTHAVRLQSEFDVMKELYVLKESEDRGAMWLFNEHLEVLSNSKLEDEKDLYEKMRTSEMLDKCAECDADNLEEVTVVNP